ncbi:hypothetical protein QBC46DRAFT_175263 [Diplogelasinospora grovesii]|uniref:Uncharacterized protein n=1 Tax=Diplogelasinospora grovesii TaxID=303347 RepID=A0AAN6N2M8_9PEZI|nr:hypothetical protein QBC46DRAFT_175263 [Diplogelasinospora grovesii]
MLLLKLSSSVGFDPCTTWASSLGILTLQVSSLGGPSIAAMCARTGIQMWRRALDRQDRERIEAQEEIGLSPPFRRHLRRHVFQGTRQVVGVAPEVPEAHCTHAPTLFEMLRRLPTCPSRSMRTYSSPLSTTPCGICAPLSHPGVVPPHRPSDSANSYRDRGRGRGSDMTGAGGWCRCSYSRLEFCRNRRSGGWQNTERAVWIRDAMDCKWWYGIVTGRVRCVSCHESMGRIS